MNKVNILICQEDTLEGQLKTLNYLVNQSGKFVTIGRIIKPPKTIDAQIRSQGVVILDLTNSVAFNLDRKLIPEAIKLYPSLDVRIHRKTLDTKYDDFKNYPCYINAYKIYGADSLTKRVVAGKRVENRIDTFSIMHPSEKIRFGDAENGVLLIYTEDELMEKLASMEGKLKLVGATYDEEKQVVKLNKPRW